MRFRAILLLLLFAAIACTKSKPPPMPPPKPTGTDTIVYIGGLSTATTANGIGVVWKNDTLLTGADSGAVLSISVNGSDLYALGQSGIYTKNGIRPPVQSPLAGSGILATGTDIYITGHTIGVNPAFPLYWKNGQVINLTATHSPIGYVGATNAITSSGSDVYICGNVEADMFSDAQAVYWKNDSVHFLPNGFLAFDIAVSGDSVFVCGSAGPLDAYWINDSVHRVSTSETLTGITVSGSDVYVCGYNVRDPNDDAFYLKNGQKTLLANAVVVTGIAVHGTDVYCVGGDQSGNAVYWKNGVIHILGPGVAYCIKII
jgi:hypothetical protein